MKRFDTFIEDDQFDILDYELFSSEENYNNQYLVFHTCNDTYYAIAVSYVRELVDIKTLKKSPNSDKDSLLIATANLRDQMIPVFIGDSYFESSFDNSLDYRTALILEHNSKLAIMLLNEIDNLVIIKKKEQSNNQTANSKSYAIAKINLEKETILCNIIDIDILFNTLGLQSNG